MTKVRIGQVGVAGHGQTILNAIRSSSNLQLASIFDTKKDDANRVSREFGVTSAKNYEDLLSDREIQAVALVTPNHLHAEQVAKAVNAGKHVFVEKPMAQSIAEARRMISQTQEAGLILMVGHNTRRRSVFRRAKKLIGEQHLGKVVGAEMNVSRPAGLFDDVPSWKADPKLTPLLPMAQLGIHFVDTIHYLLDTTVTHVSCVAANVVMKGGALDASAAVLKAANGIPITLSCYYVTPDVYNVRIYGTNGILECWNSRVKLEIMKGNSLDTTVDESFPSEGPASFVEEMTEFGECIMNGHQPETGGKEGLMALAVIEAMMESLAKQSIVQVQTMNGGR